MVASDVGGAERFDDPPDEPPRSAVPPTAEPIDPTVSVTLYLRSSASPPAKRRQTAIRERFDALDAAGIVPEATVRGWDRHAGDLPGDDPDTLALYDELTAAVGDRGHLDPFFRESSTGFGDRSVVVPVLCLAVRRDDAVTGLYPCWSDGTHWSIEDGIRALETGGAVENLA
jgi:hypothetical protein